MAEKFLPLVFLVFSFHPGGVQSSALEQSSPSYDFDASQVHWNKLSFKSKIVFGSAISEVKLEGFRASNTENLLISPPHGIALKTPESEVFTLTVNSTIDPLFGSKDNSKTKVWFIPERAAVLQRIRVRTGKEKWLKTYRWTEEGVYRLRKKPHDSNDETLPSERWKDISESFYPYDLNSLGCLFASEPSLLLYVASAASLSSGDQPLSLCIFNKKQMHHVQINAEGTEKIEVNYLEKSSLNKIKKKGTIDVLKLSIKTRPLTEREEEAEPFSFLKLNGDFDIYIEKNKRIPVLIKGKTSKVGNINIKLQEVGLKSMTD